MSEPTNTLGNRLGELRSFVKLSQADLARDLAVSPSLISHWEAGTRAPSQTQILALARHLGVSLDFLLNDRPRPVFSFRGKSSLNPKQQQAVNSVLTQATEQTYFVESMLRMAGKPIQNFILRADFAMPQVATLAAMFRNALKLNRRPTLSELKQALAETGIHVFEWNLPYGVSGMSYRGNVTVIFINSLHDRARRLFTLSHELAHVIFHLDRGAETTTSISEISSNRDPKEKEANRFASEFLIPDAELRSLADTYGERLADPAVMEAIARSFHVSRDAIFYRLAEMGRCDWSAKSRYFTAHIEKDHGDLRVTSIEEQVPGSLLETALALYFTERVSIGKLAEWFFTSRYHMDEFIFSLSEEKDDALADAVTALNGTAGL